jgi:hypothetical protein
MVILEQQVLLDQQDQQVQKVMQEQTEIQGQQGQLVWLVVGFPQIRVVVVFIILYGIAALDQIHSGNV